MRRSWQNDLVHKRKMNNQFVLPREAVLSNFATNAKAGPRIQSRSNALPVLTGGAETGAVVLKIVARTEQCMKIDCVTFVRVVNWDT